MTVQAWILMLVAIASLWAAIIQTIRLIKTARIAQEYMAASRIYSDQAAEQAQKFMNACKLVDIKRNGRLNYFTFIRNDDIFTIETMGLMSDVPDDWRRLAGLTTTATVRE